MLDELRNLIWELVQRIRSEKALRAIYTLANRLYLKEKD